MLNDPKITSPIEQLPTATKALDLLGQLFNVPTMIISLILSNLHSTKPLHLPHFSVPSSLLAPKNQNQNPRMPSALVPDDIRSPAFQERSWEITMLRISQLKHWIVSQLTPHHLVRALTPSIPRNTLTLHTVGRVINTGYPWLVTRPETNTRPPLCKMSRPAMVIAATMTCSAVSSHWYTPSTC